MKIIALVLTSLLFIGCAAFPGQSVNPAVLDAACPLACNGVETLTADRCGDICRCDNEIATPLCMATCEAVIAAGNAQCESACKTVLEKVSK